MKNIILPFALALWSVVIIPNIGNSAQKTEDIDPCSLIAAEKVFAAFPLLLKAEKQPVGPGTVCNYLDKFDIPALIVSVSEAGPHARDTLSLLDPGYLIEEVPDLGEDAAVAIQQENPAFGLKKGIAVLHINKDGVSLNLSFTRINIQAEGAEFDSVKNLATEMLSNL